MTAKTPIRAVFNESNVATGLAEFQSGEFIGVTYGGIGTSSLSQNAILLGSGTDAVRSSAIQIEGSVISSTDSSIIQIADGLTVTGDLTVTGTTTTVNSTTINITNSFVFEGATEDSFETTLGVIDPTADRTINLPNVSGTLPVLAAPSTTQITATPEELNYVDGVTSNIQTQIDTKASTAFAIAQAVALG